MNIGDIRKSLHKNDESYTCSDCGDITYAPKKDFKETVKKRKGKCVICIEKEYARKWKKAQPVKEITETDRVCEICDKIFSAKKAKYCSSICRKKGMETSRFYKGLKDATVEANMADVHVFGQGKYAVSIHKNKRKK